MLGPDCFLWQGYFLCNRICSQLEMVLSARLHERLPRKCAKLLFLASEWLGRFAKTYLELFPAPGGALLHEITSCTFPIQLGQIRLETPIGSKKTYFPIRALIVVVFDPLGSEKYPRWFCATGHVEKRETALDRSWRIAQVVLRRETAVSFEHFRGKRSCERADSTIPNWLQIRPHNY